MEDANQSVETIETQEIQQQESAPPVVVEETQKAEPETFLEIKYNKEDVKLDREKAAELAQKGMNYEKAIERSKQEARDAYIAEQGYTWNGKPITTEAEYRQAEKDQAAIDAYREQKLPDDVIAELVEGKKFREKYTEAEQKSAERAKVESDFRQFTETFPDAKPEDIPTSVWADVNAGKSLVDAYTKYDNQTLREKLAAVEQAKQIEQQNLANAASSTGSVTGNGANVPTFFSKSQVDNMSQSEINKNWTAINESMKNPKFYD
jgi:hypothetical protein